MQIKNPMQLGDKELLEMRERVSQEQGTPVDARRLFLSHEEWRRSAIINQSVISSLISEHALDGLPDSALERYAQMSSGEMYVQMLGLEDVLYNIRSCLVGLMGSLPKQLAEDPDVAQWVRALEKEINQYE